MSQLGAEMCETDASNDGDLQYLHKGQAFKSIRLKPLGIITEHVLTLSYVRVLMCKPRSVFSTSRAWATQSTSRPHGFTADM